MRGKTQASTILEYLHRYGKLTQVVASGFGINRLAAVVNKINNSSDTPVIEAEYHKGFNCPRYAEYRLVGS